MYYHYGKGSNTCPCSEVVLFLGVTNVLSLWEGVQHLSLFRGWPLLRGN